jgi:hypothetical protein
LIWNLFKHESSGLVSIHQVAQGFVGDCIKRAVFITPANEQAVALNAQQYE